ncbi:MAG TPA: DUF721 domain-containing protein [Planctomycetota bacterium]|nr:DUF721 domain-containing protein [Planctomycetota bacterium]
MEPGALHDLLRRVAPKAAGRRSAKVAEAVARAWEKAAGPELARQARVRSVRDGEATIATASAPLCHELASFRREALLRAVNAALAEAGAPEIKALHFRTGSP